MQIYGFPLNAEQVWLPKEPRQISSLHPIHAGTSIIVGTRGRAIIVDIQKTLLVQILSHDDSDTTEIRSLAVRVFMHKFLARYLLNFSATMTRMTDIAWLPLHRIKASSSGNHRESGASVSFFVQYILRSTFQGKYLESSIINFSLVRLVSFGNYK